MDEIKEANKTPKEINIPSIGVGTLRAVGSWILLMLGAESESMRPRIILEVMYRLGISIDDITREDKESICRSCGVSYFLHKENNRGGKTCPK